MGLHKASESERNQMRLVQLAKIVYLMMLIPVFLMASCQATPEEIVVLSKTGNIEELAKQTPSASAEVQKPSEKEVWSETLISDDGQVTINIDAEIIRPDVQSIPMYKVQRNPFTMLDFDKLADYFDVDDNMYVVNTLGMPTEEVAEIVLLKAQGILSSLKDELSDREKRYLENAVDAAIFDRERAASRDDFKPFVRANYADDDKEIRTMFFPEDSADFPNMIMLFTDDEATAMCYWKTTIDTPRGETPDENSTGFLESGLRAKDMEMSYEEAEEKAKQFVKEIAGENYDLSYACIGYKPSIYFSATVNSPQCYVFYFKQNYDGIPITFAASPGHVTFEGDNTYLRKHIPQEELKVVMDDSGVTNLEWLARTRIIEKVTENANLLPIADIKDIFLKQVFYQYTWESDPLDEKTMTIESIELGMMITAEKDNPNEYYVLPVWDFVGYSETKYLGEEPRPDPMGGGLIRESFMTINAIDGTIINRGLGY